MAHLFAADLSLGPFDCKESSNLEINTCFVNEDAFVGKECDKWTHCMQALGKEIHPAGFVDYLGSLPVLETSVGASSTGPDPANIADDVSTQLTLFYAGTVNVFANVPADKAQMIMSMAEGGNPSWPAERVQVSEEGQAQELADLLVPCQGMVPKALPLARKESLARFLERRKERVRMMALHRAKGDQGVGCLNASTQMLYNGHCVPWGMHMHGLNPDYFGRNCAYAAEQDWASNYENSKQVSEGESAT